MALGPHGAFRIWLLPLSILLCAGLALFGLSFLLDAWLSPRPPQVLHLVVGPNPEAAASTLGNAGEVVAAVLAIAITVVAIIVELASNRYTHRVTELFVSEPVNAWVMGFFVMTALQAVWVSLVFDHTGPSGFVPYVGIATTMAMLTICLLLLLPYFNFVFAYLSPIQIVHRIRTHTLDVIAGRTGAIPAARRKREAIRGVEQLSDVALNAMGHKDKGVSMASVDALRDLVLDYQRIRPDLDDEWFRVDGPLAHNPDFVSMAPEVLEDVTRRRVWFEMKVLRQYQTLYGEALNRMRDIDYLVAINTRLIAQQAIERRDRQCLALVIKFFNTYLRAAINARDVRTAYNVLNQYRLLAEHLLEWEAGAQAVEIAGYFKYYGQLAFHASLPFILETVAYDLCSLNELAFDRGAAVASELLDIFLQVDKESEGDVQEASLRGVRKAQIKLASHYLRHGDESLARRVYQDMASEDAQRMASIRDELAGVRSAEFWEITDRGINFDYLTPERRTHMLRFFGWFGDRIPAASPNDSRRRAPGPARDGTEASAADLLEPSPGMGRDPRGG